MWENKNVLSLINLSNKQVSNKLVKMYKLYCTRSRIEKVTLGELDGYIHPHLYMLITFPGAYGIAQQGNATRHKWPEMSRNVQH